MVRASSGLLILASIAWAQRPTDADAAALIERTRQKALAYARSLPDFECTEVVHRYVDNAPKLRLRMAPTDTLTVRIRYSQYREEHQLMLVNNRKTTQTFESLAGAIGTGEFGATLSAIFDPASETGFAWAGSRTNAKRQIAQYRYLVDVERSRYHIRDGGIGTGRDRVVGYHGMVEMDSETGEVVRFSYVAEDLPNGLAIRAVSTTVDYAFANVGGQDYLLPARSESEVRGAEVSARNEIEFRDYHKFTADSSIQFGPVK
jgi:hypothetical protein